jgi:hypothetical protein
MVGGLSGLVARLRAAQVEMRPGVQALPVEVQTLYAKTVTALPESTRQWIHERAKYVARTPGSENSAEFLASLKQYQGQFPNSDVMGLMFAIFKESIEETNADKKYYLQRISEMNQISQALGEYLGYLNDNSGKLNGKNDADAVCAEGRLEVKKGIKKLQALQSRFPSGTSVGVQEPKTVGELKASIKAIATDLKRKDPELKKITEDDSARIEMAHTRYKALYPKMLDAMKKIHK